jgi:hypothetical protein
MRHLAGCGEYLVVDFTFCNPKSFYDDVLPGKCTSAAGHPATITP